MLTYEDFLACDGNERKEIEFIQSVIAEHVKSEDYLFAADAHAYYSGENPAIMRYEKLVYDMQGRAHVDMWTANHKIPSKFFGNVINQEVAYLLGNGVRFGKKDTKEKLGKKFDIRTMQVEKYARIAGQAFGFWNKDHLEVYKYLDLAPVYGEQDGAMMMGVRHWQIDPSKPLHVTFFRPDGYIELVQPKGEPMVVLKQLQPYIVSRTRTRAGDVDIVSGQNYGKLPIVPMYANDEHRSILRGRKNAIDALDIARSGMVNNVSEGELIYWVLTNCGGMDDVDDAKFIERLHTTHVAHADGDAGATAEAHTIEAPIDGSKVTVDELKATLYDDFQAFDPHAITASNQSATAVRASYIPLDLKCDIEIEPQVTEFILGILDLVGIEDEPTYQRNQLINKLEETQTLVIQAEYLPEDYVMEKMLAINGDIDRLEDIRRQIDADAEKRTRPVVNDLADELTGNGNEAE